MFLVVLIPAKISRVRQMQTEDLQTCRHADLQTQDTGLSQFILKITLCNLRHSTSCAVRLVRFKDCCKDTSYSHGCPVQE